MCGIAGYFGRQILSDETIRNCLSTMRHRGPDACGVYKHIFNERQRVYLLHVRLSIVDIHYRANQPYEFEHLAMSYNGEIYNYIECRSALKQRGVVFETESDTEVLIKKIAADGLEGLADCEGMWAFALYDKHTGTLVLCRDRFGEKPLYIYEDDSGFYFGSEIKNIATLVGCSLQVNSDHLRRYLVNGYKSLFKTSETFYNRVYRLPAASQICIDSNGHRTEKRYWMPALTLSASAGAREVAALVRETLIEALRIRMRADVPIAFCMSGGIDCNSLICIAQKILNCEVHGFTIANSDARYEEMEYVKCVVNALQLKHTVIPLRRERFIQNLRTLIKQHDGPVSTISYYVHWLLMQAMRDFGYRVAISGTAGDEFFTGYFDHHNLYLYEVWGTTLGDAALHAWNTHIKPVVRNPYLCQADLYVKNPAERRHIYFRNDEFTAYLKEPWEERFSEEKFTGSLLQNRRLNELFHEVVPVILHEDDLNAMSVSIENRSPFLDRRLFDIAFSVSPELLMRDGYSKVILRDAMDGIVPKKILWNRKKVGFNAPLQDLLDLSDPEVRESILDDGPIFEWVFRESIEKLMQRNPLSNSESKYLFNFLNVKLFLEMAS